MTKQIRTYDELMVEKERLKLLMTAQKELVRQDVNLIKDELQPVKKAISVIGKFTSKENRGSVLTVAADTVIDMFVKKVLLSKAGFITRMAVPFLMKNFSSHVIADNKDKIISKLASLFGKKHENGVHQNASMAFDEESSPDDEEED
jgi:hypothetical protein